MWISQQFKFSANGSNENLNFFLMENIQGTSFWFTGNWERCLLWKESKQINPYRENAKSWKSEDILGQFQTHQAKSEEDNDCDNKTENCVASEQPLRLTVESVINVLQNTALYSTTGNEMQSFF